MTSNPILFEVSFEVCNKVGGIHTVLTTKAPTLIRTFGDDHKIACHIEPAAFEEMEPVITMGAKEAAD